MAVCWLCASLTALRGREKGQGSQQHDISGENRKTSVSLLRRQLQRGTHLSTRGPRGKADLAYAELGSDCATSPVSSQSAARTGGSQSAAHTDGNSAGQRADTDDSDLFIACDDALPVHLRTARTVPRRDVEKVETHDSFDFALNPFHERPDFSSPVPLAHHFSRARRTRDPHRRCREREQVHAARCARNVAHGLTRPSKARLWWPSTTRSQRWRPEATSSAVEAHVPRAVSSRRLPRDFSWVYPAASAVHHRRVCSSPAMNGEWLTAVVSQATVILYSLATGFTSFFAIVPCS